MTQYRFSGAWPSRYLGRGLRFAAVVALALACGCGGKAAQETYPAPVKSDGGPPLVEPTDFRGLGVLLKAGELSGWIHGAVHDRDLYVFTYRKPGDFFDFGEFPLSPANPSAAAKLLQIKRHDAVLIKGTFIQDAAPIHHISLEDMTVVTPFVADETAATPHLAETAIPDDLNGQSDVIGKVHAVDTDGRILVIEYGDAVIPVFVSVPALTAGLYRNDKIRLAFQFAPTPPHPTHLWLDTAAAKPLEVLERLLDYHGKPFDADGVLVRFPQSPEITSDVYALEAVEPDGVTREYTLLNQDPQIFKVIHDRLGAAWKSHPADVMDGRNKLVNPSIHVHAHGTFNLVAPNQANAQILLDSADDVTVTFSP